MLFSISNLEEKYFKNRKIRVSKFFIRHMKMLPRRDFQNVRRQIL